MFAPLWTADFLPAQDAAGKEHTTGQNARVQALQWMRAGSPQSKWAHLDPCHITRPPCLAQNPMRHIQLALALAILASPALAQSSRSDGGALVKTQCAPCHAIARTGASPNPKAPPLREIARKYKPEDLEEAFAEGIMVGHQSSDMPAFELEPAQIDALTAYLRALKR